MSVEFRSVEFSVEGRPDPPRPEPARITDYEDCLLLIRPHRVMDWRHPDGTTADAVRADVVVLDDEDNDGLPLLLRGVTVIQGALVRTLKRRMGVSRGPVTTLARLSRIPSRRHEGRMVWVFTEPTENDVDLARDYLDEAGDPFAPASAA